MKEFKSYLNEVSMFPNKEFKNALTSAIESRFGLKHKSTNFEVSSSSDKTPVSYALGLSGSKIPPSSDVLYMKFKNPLFEDSEHGLKVAIIYVPWSHQFEFRLSKTVGRDYIPPVARSESRFMSNKEKSGAWSEENVPRMVDQIEDILRDDLNKSNNAGFTVVVWPDPPTDVQMHIVLQNPALIEYIANPALSVQQFVLKHDPKLVSKIRNLDPKLKHRYGHLADLEDLGVA